MEKDIVQTLKFQHIELKNVVNKVSESAEGDTPDFSLIFEGLNSFKDKLDEHLKLEDNAFYPEVLKKLESQKINIEDTKEYWEKMGGIKNEIMIFLNKYNSEASIKSNLDDLRGELKKIIEALLLRIDSEESGVFTYWYM